jgi:hypothetical protein
MSIAASRPLKLSIILCCLAVCCGCSRNAGQHTWVWITENGDKVGTALVLTEKAGQVMDGKFFILDPRYPRNLSKGIGYDLKNLNCQDKNVRCDVTLIDESSATGTLDMHFIILLKGTFDGDSLPAEFQEGAGTKEAIIFSKEH